MNLADFLSLGPKFEISPVSKSFDLVKFLADVQNIINVCPVEDRNVLQKFVWKKEQVAKNYYSTNINFCIFSRCTIMAGHVRQCQTQVV